MSLAEAMLVGMILISGSLIYLGRCILKSRQVTNIYPNKKGPKSIADMTPQEREDFEKQKEAIIREAKMRIQKRKMQDAQGNPAPTGPNTRPPRYVVDRTKG